MNLIESRQKYFEALTQNQLLQWLQKDFDYEVILEEYLLYRQQDHEKEHHSRRAHEFYPSEIGKCMRRLVLDILLELSVLSHKIKIPEHTQKIFFYGDMIQDYMVDPVMKWWIEKHQLGTHQCERSITVTIPSSLKTHHIIISGRMDEHLIIRNPDDNTIMIPIEVKSQSKAIETKTDPSLHHLKQLYVYMTAMGASSGKLLYIEKEGNPKTPDSRISQTFHVNYDYKEWEVIAGTLDYVDKCITTKLLPPAEASLIKEMNWECRYCDHKEQCAKQSPGMEIPYSRWLNKNG